MSDDHDEDPTVPGSPMPGEGGPPSGEDPTLPSTPVGNGSERAQDSGDTGDSDREDPTVPAIDGNKLGAADDLIGKVLGGCRIDKLLGRGAMGAVYKAHQLKLTRDVAVKVIRPEMMTDPRMLKRFEVEARTVGQFNSAHVVMVHDVGFELGVHYLVMEFIQGKNLREHVKLLPGGRLPAGDALPLIRQACKGLEEARRLGVVHRDIKPDNLMLTDQGVLKIADFGIAKPVEQDFSMTMTSELIGTPLYMSPEQCQGGADIDFRSDMYSLGATFFYLLTGEPPIRASSVYELIQTKTKLENLCLWKALPELDENHPLSRVIERMTANDRDDRYDSYEDLLNDLVLVEAGETINLPKKKPKPKPSTDELTGGGGDNGGGGGGGSGLLVAALAVLLLGGAGAGYWWWQKQQSQQNQQGQQPRRDVVVTPPDPNSDGEVARTALARFRERLRQNGPGGSLREEIAGLSVTPELEPERARLLADVEAGLAIDQRLAKVVPPEEPRPPFDRIKDHFAMVAESAKLEPGVGPELREWLAGRVAAARAEAALGAKALAALVAEFARWQQDRRAAGNDQKLLAELGSRLDVIENGRNVLVDELPGQRKALDRALPRAELDRARRGLSESVPVEGSDVDVAQALAEIRRDLEKEGGTDSLRTRARNLKPTRSEQIEELNALVDAIDEARKIEQQIAVLAFPSMPQPPFDDVRRYYAAIDRALQPLAAEGELPTWARELRERRRDEAALQASVVAACANAWRAWQQLRASGATSAALASAKAQLEAAVAAAGELFPAAADALAAAVPQATLDQAMAEAERAGRVEAWRSAFAAANGKLMAVRSLLDWQRAEAGLTADAEALRRDLEALGGDAQLAASLQQFDGALGRWRAAQQSLREVCALFGRGALSDCERNARLRAAANEGGTEFALLQELATSCNNAFRVLEEELDIAAARAGLQAARDRAKALPSEVSLRIDTWLTGLAQLAEAADGMVAIPAGSTKNPRADVSAFFIAATECSQAEFAAFQNEVRAAMRGEDDAERLASLQARLGDVGMDAATFGKMLRRSTSKPDLPMEAVTWYEALAFCRWYGKDLPTAAEWALAAFGDGKKYTFPWGDDEAELRRMATKLLPVDEGGLSWRRRDGVRLHFLAGNVEEWLLAGPGREASTAGGRCDMRPRDLRAQACGDEFYKRRKTDSRGGVGFRPVLRPRDFTGLSWPK